MDSQNPYRNSLYPQVIHSNPDEPSSSFANPNPSSTSNLYPTLDMKDMVENLFPDHVGYLHPPSALAPPSASAPPLAAEEVLIRIPGAILNLIDKEYSVELACGDLTIVHIRQGESVVAVFARVADDIQWPLAKDIAAVKLDGSHYFFSFRAPKERDSDSDSSDEEDKKKEKKKNRSDDYLSYGLTIVSKGQEGLLKELDGILQNYSSFTLQKVSESAKKVEVLDESLAKEMSPADLKTEKKKEEIEGKCAAYWTTLAPNVEDYNGLAAKLIAAGSGQLVKGILWCGDVTVERLKQGNEAMQKRLDPCSNTEISPETLKRIKRVKRVTRMSEKVANGVLSGVVKVSGYFTSSVANSKVGKKFFGMLPGEIVLASLDGFGKVFDAVEVAGKNVMATSSTVTTELVTKRYGQQAANATNEGLDAAGHAVGTAWAALKIRKALNPKSALSPKALAKSAVKAAAAEAKAKNSK
ncbi:protein EARLY-RESPONSIVE TO DEHYDRATION 7, chloroplastic isoform X2 [Cucumis melo]|nr:protein EARLY-RESPONSIVE TO DEHYDRATION 7, chloroplastic isoform X2 [Cucumis melo]